jgi:ATP-dependent Zn protease
MTETAAQHGGFRAWWRRPALWAIALIAVLGLIAFAVVEQTNQPAAISYGAFLDQLEASNIASVDFRGTEIDGRFKQASNGQAQNAFRTRVPDFGDPGLITALRHHQVTIDVASSTSWLRLLAGVPLPMLFFVGALLVVGIVRLVRGRKGGGNQPVPMHPMQGMIALVSGLFSRQEASTEPPKEQRDMGKG